jgi:micrococcal nuclease
VPAQRVTISRVVDGDTVHARPADGSPTIKVRVLGIDAPELRDPDGHVECWAPESTEFATATLLGRSVTVLGDPTQAARDRYGRCWGM